MIPGPRLVALAAAMVVVACVDRGSPHGAPSVASSSSSAAAPSAPTSDSDAPAPVAGDRDDRLVADEELGPLMARLSESPGDFPSDNFVSNETSYLDVAPALQDLRLRGRAYVGVGPEQSYTYIAMLEPAVSYIVDIRRGNLLEHMVIRGCFETGETRAAFLSALLARRPLTPVEVDGFAPLATAFATARPDRLLRDEGVARSRALLDRLHVVHSPGDDGDLARIHDAFFARGLSLAFTMKNGTGGYPTLGQMLGARDPSGAEGSFLASEERYARVRRRVLANRVVPVTGDFGGHHALAAIAADMHARGLLLGAFYTSNVEQYLFDDRSYGAFVESVRALPRDDASLLVRVWFDQGRRHPLQRPGRRTTSLVMGASAFLRHATAKPYGSYWDVVTAPVDVR
jgi:hypothetical protein